MDNLRFVLGFLPWIVFSFAAQRLDANGVAWSATIAVVMTLVALAVAHRHHGPKILTLGSFVLFSVIAVVGFVGGPAVDQWLFEWGRPLVGVLLGLYALVTVPVMPFTEEYARQTVPREYWGTPTFHKINRVLSAAWGVAIMVIGASGLLVTALDAHAVDASQPHMADLLLNWVVPIGVLWGMIRFTAAYPERVRKESAPGTGATDLL
ncbi:hypothetical protein [Pseudonocardia zijingensis]|jgi:hypothetical protein|uniref:Intracellular septation protein A n=1 Tax=Pseudonocardia zijingensis TaxID=153376 RepID=A0ABN1P265_9PSEU